MDMIDLEIVLVKKRPVVLAHIDAIAQPMLNQLLLDEKYQFEYSLELLGTKLPRFFDVPLGYDQKMPGDFARITQNDRCKRITFQGSCTYAAKRAIFGFHTSSIPASLL